MPSFAVTAPPCGPVVGMVTAGVCGVPGAGTFGMVALAQSRTSTWPAATEALATAVTPNNVAILRS
jgi:hypothetical protein